MACRRVRRAARSRQFLEGAAEIVLGHRPIVAVRQAGPHACGRQKAGHRLPHVDRARAGHRPVAEEQSQRVLRFRPILRSGGLREHVQRALHAVQRGREFGGAVSAGQPPACIGQVQEHARPRLGMGRHRVYGQRFLEARDGFAQAAGIGSVAAEREFFRPFLVPALGPMGAVASGCLFGFGFHGVSPVGEASCAPGCHSSPRLWRGWKNPEPGNLSLTPPSRSWPSCAVCPRRGPDARPDGRKRVAAG